MSDPVISWSGQQNISKKLFTVEYDPASKRKDILPPATMWMDLMGTVLREMSPSHKDDSCVIPFRGRT